MTEGKFYIDILKDYKDKFKNHLNVEDNYRTIFSGIFGIGKTTFLKEFFALEEIAEEYEVIHLFPVNYSIASNEDIFELIKFDIFYRLLMKDIAFDVESIAIEQTAYQFIVSNYTDILFPFLSFIPEVGGNIKDLAEKLLQLKNKFEDYHAKIQANELDSLSNFLNEFSKKKGTIYEADFYTELIISLISKLKSNKKKRVVLVIDDLDRIDPEHIFRLLNIFSAHTDSRGDESNYNKFDFDKIIFVCDIQNIRNIYRTKFGVNTDFNGYIDKFYSKSFFQFKAHEVLIKYKELIVEKFKFSNQLHGASALKYENAFSGHFMFILEHLFLNYKISLRDLNRICSTSIDFDHYTLSKLGYPDYLNIHFNVIQLYDIFYQIFGRDKVKLLEAFTGIHHFIYNDVVIKPYLEDVILLTYFIKTPNTFNQNLAQGSTIVVQDNIRFKIRRLNNSKKDVECEITNFDDIKNNFEYFNLLHKIFIILANRD